MRPWFGVNPPPRDWDGGWGYDPWRHRRDYYYEKTTTTTTTNPAPAQPAVDEEQVRKIVREEIADILPIDVPDAPPEDL